MQKTPSMIIRRLASILFASMLLLGVLLLSPAALALNANVDVEGGGTSSDASQGDISESQCASLNESLAGALGCESSDQVMDLTTYDGTMSGPDAEGYDATLTQTTNARDFIQQVVNYALGFLGLVTTVIIIYGGIMYVMSRGDEEMATKGKKSIGYAAIGILLILGSFAIVNTLIGAGGGDVNSGTGGNTGGTTISETGASFDVQQVLSELQDITKDYMSTYQTYLTVSQEVAFMKSQEIPIIISVSEEDYTASGLAERIGELITNSDPDFADKYQLIDESSVTDYTTTLRSEVQKIQSTVDSLSDSYEAAQGLYDYLRSSSEATSGMEGDGNGRGQGSGGSNEALGCAVMDYESTSFYNELSLGVTVTQADIREIDSNICAYINAVQTAADADYTQQVALLIDRFNELELLFDSGDQQYGTGSQLTDVTTAMKAISNPELSEGQYTGENAGVLQRAHEEIGANTVRDIVESIDGLYSMIENIKFVQVRLTASTTKGNAPLIVRFNALGTEDPSGTTVTDSQIEWDLNGDGKFEESLGGGPTTGGVSATEISGAAVSATFKEPGTYRVRLRVQSSDSNIAAGVSTVTIQVEPSKSKIVLTATTGTERPTTLADFREFPETDVDNYKVTMTEALNGIYFDASKTTDGDGNIAGIVYYEWEFGDNDSSSGKAGEAGGDTVTHLYGKQGTYNVSLTVTDATGVKDRKLFTLYVASPAARISSSPASGAVGTTFEFDGSGSSSDISSIVSWQWSATKSGTAVPLTDSTGQTISATFDSPGLYTVTLEVSDNDKTDTASVEVMVESTPPVATYDYSVPSSAQPATFIFDGSDSYDPDEGDTITYEWDFDGTEGDDYEIFDAENDQSKVTVQFLTVGDHDVALTVYDQYQGDLKKSDTAVAAIRVESILDVGLEIQGENARHLDDNGQVEVKFTASTQVGTAFQIDYGDGNTDYSDIISGGESSFTHVYESAGVFDVTLTTLDDNDNKNSISKRLYIGTGDAPIAVLSVSSEGEDIGSGNDIHGSIKTKFTFDASQSVNVDGTNKGLQYSWNFGDGVTSSQKTVTHIFEETTTYTVILTVKDQDDNAIKNETSMQINIEGINPKITGLTVVPQGDKLETPLKVNVSVDAYDEDGKITYIKGWYYDLNDTATELGTVISDTTNFSLTINTKGLTGETVEYGFAAEVKDNENNLVSSFDELDTSEIPTLEVTNGTNESPVASFTVDKTSIYIGEELTLSSTSYDPDGEIVNYWWDVEGDGFYNNEPQETSSLTYNFTQVHPEGVELQLKVEDNAGATSTSQSITVYVDSVSAAPDAAFFADISGTTVNFRNNSTIDTENGAALAGIYWDFDLAVDSNGNGIPDDDIDSLEENPVHSYGALGVYQVKMTLMDNTGQSDTLSQDVNVVESSGPTADFTYSVTDKTVAFTNESTFDTANGVEVRSYNWDLDLNVDTNGDTDPENDSDAVTKNPTFTYPDFGEYDVKLTVEDSMGKTDTTLQTVNVANPIQSVNALLTASPTPNSLSQIILQRDGDNVTFFYGAEDGSGTFTYEFDKNIFYDTDGDGIRDNDVDYSDDSSGTWKTPFFKSYGQVVTKLTVTDTETGETDIATLQVAFEGSLGGANLFNATPTEMLFLIISAMLTAILGISISFRYKPTSKPSLR